MAGPSWLVDSNRIATKIKSASGPCDPKTVVWKSNPTKSCPNCYHVVDNSDVNQAWPGLPRGVKFDPTDHEIVLHLLAKCGVGDFKPHPFINEFIPTVEEHDGICYTHPEKLPGVKRDGTVSHFFHRAIKAYSTGTRKRRKIHSDDFGDFRWHKTGRTKPVTVDGVQCGCKKIMVLYVGPAKGGKPEKTNWVMHQYHLGTGEDEKEGEYVVSKIFYQQQPQLKPSGRDDEEIDVPVVKVDPVTPKSVTPDPPRTERRVLDVGSEREVIVPYVEPTRHETVPIDKADSENASKKLDLESASEAHVADEILENDDNHGMEESKWWDSESQHLLDSQQLVEGLSLCDELLQSQSPRQGDGTENGVPDGKPRLADYAHLGSENLKKDLEECQHLVLDPANLELDTPPEFRLSQLEFGSQESFLAWGGCR